MTGGFSGPSVFVPKGNLNASADAFGRLRVSSPYTLFDNSFRYGDTERKWNTKVRGTTTVEYAANEGLMDLTVGSADGDDIVRQTDRVFPYQPGKSLLILNTFTMASPKENLRQRVGYFLEGNGYYLEQDGLDAYIVERTLVSGSPVNTRIAQSEWNVDKLDGTGPSGVSLDLTKSHIFWIDMEWLGVGSVRAGFVINGQYIISHIFHHANSITGTYITTACLSCRYEITNTGNTTGNSTLKQICSSVMSEGGYQQIGLTRSVSNPLTGVNLSLGKTNHMISIRLRSGRTDAVVIPREINLYGLQATAFNYKLIRGATINGGTWAIKDSASSVEYNITADSAVGGTIVLESIFRGQSTVAPLILTDLFEDALQLSRQIITADSVGDAFTIAITPTTNNDDAIAALTWQEKTA
jgi:hypothetical protein